MELIDKAAVMAQANIEITGCRIAAQEGILTEFGKGKLEGLEGIVDFLDTLEVKEVDFEKIWKEYFKYRGDVATVNVKHLAKHFYELGLKTKKEVENDS